MQSPVNLGLATTERFYSEEMINVRFYIDFLYQLEIQLRYNPIQIAQKAIN